MKRTSNIILFLILSMSVFGQVKTKQSSPYFEFTYKCEFLGSKYDSQKGFWTYIYGDSINDVGITIDVKRETHWGDDDKGYKECIDNMNFDYGIIKATSGYFCGIYALIIEGKENDESIIKGATFSKSNRAYIVSVLSSYSESVKEAYKQIEKSFVFK